MLKGQLCHVNLIPLNPIPGTRLRAARREQVRAFAQVLTDAHIPCTVRIERGQDIAAACGQLKIAHEPGSHQRSLNPAVVTKDADDVQDSTPPSLAFFDPISGISGDMALGALLDAGLPWRCWRRNWRNCRINGYQLKAETEQYGLRGTHVRVR